MKLHELYGKTLKNGDIGLELEVEYKKGRSPVQNIPENWITHNDESLKNGVEYVSRQPFKVGPSYVTKIRGLTDLLNHPDSGVEHGNPRASVHCHINVLDKTPLQVWNAIVTYWLLENIIMQYCAPHRLGNHFCLRLEDGPGILKDCYSDIGATTLPFTSFSPNMCKYSAMNLATVYNYGSLEFRGLHATYDHNTIVEWSTALHHLVNISGSIFSSPANVMDVFVSSSKDSFLFAVLPYEFASKLTKLDPDYCSKGKRSKRLLASLAYYTEWDQWESAVIKNFSSKNKIPKGVPVSPNTNYYNLTSDTLVGSAYTAILDD